MKATEQNGDATTLRWAGRLLSSDDLRRHLNGHRELILAPRAIITPLAADELRTRGVQIRREETKTSPTKPSRLGVAQERPDSAVESAIRALDRDGLSLTPLQGCTGPTCDWARALAECIAKGTCEAGVLFCVDPALVCCVANKVIGVRAAAVSSVVQSARALTNLGANLLAVETPGRTFFEIRQILKNLAAATLTCPPGVACTLKELETHAHR
jgi:hypothetical protein